MRINFRSLGIFLFRGSKRMGKSIASTLERPWFTNLIGIVTLFGLVISYRQMILSQEQFEMQRRDDRESDSTESVRLQLQFQNLIEKNKIDGDYYKAQLNYLRNKDSLDRIVYKHQRSHDSIQVATSIMSQKLSVRPLLQFSIQYTELGYGIYLSNVGNGPAYVLSFEVSHNGEKFNNIPFLLKVLKAKGIVFADPPTAGNIQQGAVIHIGGPFQLLTYYPGIEDEQPKFSKLIDHSISIRIKYKSNAGEILNATFPTSEMIQIYKEYPGRI